MDLTIIVVSWNVKDLTRDCLKSVYGTVRNISFEIIAVDNNSSDGSAQMISDEFPAAKLIKNKENLGFTVANNQAIKKAHGRYILLLNPDTVVSPSVIEGVLDFMDNHPDCGISSCRQTGPGGEESELDLIIKKYKPFPAVDFNVLRNIALGKLSALFPENMNLKRIIFKNCIKNLDFSISHRENPFEVDVVWGFFMMIRKDVINKIGMLDERFFFSKDDDEFCYRARQAGWKIYLCPQFSIVHLNRKSIAPLGKIREFDVITYSRLTFYRKYKGPIGLFIRVLTIMNFVLIEALVSFIFNCLLLIKGIRDERKEDSIPAICVAFCYLRNFLRVIFNMPYPAIQK